MPDGQFKHVRELDPGDAPSMRGLVVLATVITVDDLGPVLDCRGALGLGGGARPAYSMIELGPEDLGVTVALGFIDGDEDRPIVLGRVADAAPSEARSASAPVVIADGERVRVEAKQELVLCCGEDSITLRANGRLVLRGDYVETRAKGINRVRGGCVSIN